VVYLVALEDGILPHERSIDRPEQLEEERRLVFVGITRGREEVHASCARMRDYRGTRRISAPSLFLAEMTGSETEVTGQEAPPRPAFDPFGDAARAAAEEFADAIHDQPRLDPGLRVFRPDGLALDVEGAQEDLDADRPAHRSSRRAATGVERARDLALRMAGQAAASHRFEAGQRVRHTEYGEGLLQKISGVGPRSVGTVLFDGPAGTRKFLLGHGGIEPAD